MAPKERGFGPIVFPKVGFVVGDAFVALPCHGLLQYHGCDLA